MKDRTCCSVLSNLGADIFPHGNPEHLYLTGSEPPHTRCNTRHSNKLIGLRLRRLCFNYLQDNFYGLKYGLQFVTIESN